MALWTGSAIDAQRAIERQRLLSQLKTPYTAKDLLGRSLAIVESTSVSRVWTLPATQMRDEVLHYNSRHTQLGCKGQKPRLRDALTEEEALELALRIQAGFSFLELGRAANPLVRPVLLYYGAAHLLGVYSRAFFEWENGKTGKSYGHGISCVRGNDVGATRVKVAPRGIFSRVATALFLLTGMPTPFTELVAYASTPTAHTEPGGLLEHFGATEKGQTQRSFTLHELAQFDYGAKLRDVRIRHGFHKYSGLGSTALLVDLMTWFMGGWLARYDVTGWQTVLEGKAVPYRIFFDEAYERLTEFTADAILVHLEDPFQPWDQAISPTMPSPYSHDHPRFDGDPNSA